MKLLTWHGRGLFVVPGLFTLERGDSHEVDDHLGDAILRANPSEPLTIDRLPAGRSKTESPSSGEPEADDGEGHSNPNEEKE